MATVLTAADLRCPVTGKQAYPDKATAERYLQRAWERKDWNPQAHGYSEMPREAYECEHCGWWHMTSSRRQRAS